MYQNYPTYQTNSQSAIPRIVPGLRGRPVSSLDEVRATSVDFDGTISYFPDLANKRIYTKQINMDGTATLNMYELKNLPVETNNANYVTHEEFEMTIKNLLAQIPQMIQPPVKEEPKDISLQF